MVVPLIAASDAQVGSSLLVRFFVRPVPGLSGYGLLRGGVATTTFPVMVHALFGSFLFLGNCAHVASSLATLGFAHTRLMPASR